MVVPLERSLQCRPAPMLGVMLGALYSYPRMHRGAKFWGKFSPWLEENNKSPMMCRQGAIFPHLWLWRHKMLPSESSTLKRGISTHDHGFALRTTYCTTCTRISSTRTLLRDSHLICRWLQKWFMGLTARIRRLPRLNWAWTQLSTCQGNLHLKRNIFWPLLGWYMVALRDIWYHWPRKPSLLCTLSTPNFLGGPLTAHKPWKDP